MARVQHCDESETQQGITFNSEVRVLFLFLKKSLADNFPLKGITPQEQRNAIKSALLFSLEHFPHVTNEKQSHLYLISGTESFPEY